MTERERNIQALFFAELQFRLASAVRLATARGVQPLDLPQRWTYGRHVVKYEEIALRTDQADCAAFFLRQSATFLMAVAIKDAIKAVVQHPKNSPDPNVQAAYQISRLIRNAFAHGPFMPVWDIDNDCRNKVYAIPSVISLDTTNLEGTRFDWKHYGGHLALFKLCRFVRIQILKHKVKPRKVIPPAKDEIHQIGDLILTKVDGIPPDAKPIKVDRLPDGGIPLGDGYAIYPGRKEDE